MPVPVSCKIFFFFIQTDKVTFLHTYLHTGLVYNKEEEEHWKRKKNPGQEQGAFEEEYIFEIQAYGILNTVYQ